MAVSEEELENVRQKQPLPPLYSRGVPGKYAHYRIIRFSRSRDRLLEYGQVR